MRRTCHSPALLAKSIESNGQEDGDRPSGREPRPPSRDRRCGKRIRKKTDVCARTTESPCRTSEIITLTPVNRLYLPNSHGQDRRKVFRVRRDQKTCSLMKRRTLGWENGSEKCFKADWERPWAGQMDSTASVSHLLVLATVCISETRTDTIGHKGGDASS